MLVESDVLVREPLAESLRQCGYEVLEAASPDEAREVVSRGKNKIKTALIDLDAADNQGFVLVSWIRKSDPSITIITAGPVATAAQKAGDLCHQGPAVKKPYTRASRRT